MRVRVRVSSGRGSIAAAGAVSLFGSAALTARHLRSLSRDEELRALRAPLRGRAVAVSSADGTRLHAEVIGPEDAAVTVVLVPGWTEQIGFFDPMTRRLVARGFRVVAYDLRGQGSSGAACDDDYAIERYGEDLEAVLSACGCGCGCGCGGGSRGSAIVAGHSLGAMSIAAWAAEFDVASRAQGVVLMNTGLDGLITANRLIPAVLPAAVYSRLATALFLANPLPLPAVSTPLAHSIIRYVAFGPAASRAQVAYYEHMLMTCQPRVRAAAGLMMSTMDLLHALPRLTVPAVVVAGDSDRLTPCSHAEKIAEALPRLDRLVVLEQTGHMGPLERPGEMVDEIIGLAERLGLPVDPASSAGAGVAA